MIPLIWVAWVIGSTIAAALLAGWLVGWMDAHSRHRQP